MGIEIIEDKYKFNPEKWVHPGKKNKFFKKYILTTTFFVIGLILVSSIKNETRKLQKDIAELKSSLVSIKITLHEATLDHYYLTSPDNIDKLAKTENNHILHHRGMPEHSMREETTYTRREIFRDVSASPVEARSNFK